MTIFILVYKLTNGGAERVASLWAKGFAEAGHNVYLVIGDDKSPITYTVPESVKICSIASYKPFSPFRYLDRLHKLRKLVVKENPDVILGILGRALWAKIVTFDRKIPIINTEHNSFERPASAPMSWSTRFDKFQKNRIYDKVTVLTQADKEFIGDRLKNVVVLPNPLAFEPTDMSMLESKKKIVLAAGRLNVWHYKGFDNLIKAWGLIHNKYPDWKLKILGSGKDKDYEYLKILAKENGVENSLELLGFIEDPVPCYQEASIFVLSSRYEGFGMVLIEAMSQGCACVACDYKGRQSEIITNENEGLVCPPDDYQTLAETIQRAILDDDLRLRIQKGAINRSYYYSVENTTMRWEKIFQDLRK